MCKPEKHPEPLPNLLQELDNPKNLETFLALAGGSRSTQLGLTEKQFKEIVKTIAKTKPTSHMEVLQGLKDETFKHRERVLKTLIDQEEVNLRYLDIATSDKYKKLLECQSQLSQFKRELEGVSAFTGSGGQAVLDNESLREFMGQFGAMLGEVDSLLKHIDSNRVPEQTTSNGWNIDTDGYNNFNWH